MLNKWIGMGRVCKDLELRYTQSGTPVCSFPVACDSDYRDQSGQYETYFLNIVTWNKTAEFVTKYFSKGSLICIEGRVCTRKYTDNNGDNRTVTEIVADKVYFAGGKKETATEASSAQADGFTPVDMPDDDLPF